MHAIKISNRSKSAALQKYINTRIYKVSPICFNMKDRWAAVSMEVPNFLAAEAGFSFLDVKQWPQTACKLPCSQQTAAMLRVFDQRGVVLVAAQSRSPRPKSSACTRGLIALAPLPPPSPGHTWHASSNPLVHMTRPTCSHPPHIHRPQPPPSPHFMPPPLTSPTSSHCRPITPLPQQATGNAPP